MTQSQLFSKRSFLLLSLVTCFVGAVRAHYADASYASITEGTFVQDARWHELNQTEKSILIDLTQGKFAKVLNSLQNDVTAYKKLTSMYDLLWITLTIHPYSGRDSQETFVLFLLSQGVFITDRSLTGLTYSRNSYGDVYYAEKFLEFGLDPNYTFKNGDTWLIYAIKNSTEKLVELLVKNGASPLLKDSSGKNAFDHCPLVYDKAQNIDYWHSNFKPSLLIALYGSKMFYDSAAYKEWMAHCDAKCKGQWTDAAAFGAACTAVCLGAVIAYYLDAIIPANTKIA